MEIGGMKYARSCVLASFSRTICFFGKTCGSPIGANFNRLPVQLATCQPPELAFGQGYLDPVSPD